MHKAEAGGEIGANGEFYKGGQFVADTEGWVKGSSRWEGVKGEGLSLYNVLGGCYSIYKDEHWDESQRRYVTDGIYLEDRFGAYLNDDEGARRKRDSYLLSLYMDDPLGRISRQDLIDLEFALGKWAYTWHGLPHGARHVDIPNLTSLTEADVPAFLERVDAVIAAHGVKGVEQLMSEREAARKAAIVSKHIGNPGEKMERDVEVSAVIPFESDYGCGTVYKFADGDGNELVWMTSAGLKTGKTELGSDTYAKVGDRLRIKFTVKWHDTYCDVPQTKIFRVKAVA